MKRMKIILSCSDVASMIELNQFKTRQEIKDKLQLKYFPHTFLAETPKQAEKRLMVEASSETRELLKLSAALKPLNSSELGAIITKNLLAIEKDKSLSEASKKDLQKVTKSQLSTSFGTRNEAATAEKIVAKLAEKKKLVEDKKFYQHLLCEMDDTEYWLTGVIDRIEVCNTTGQRTLVEIKNRTKRIYRDVPIYDYIQVQAYLHLLDLDHGKLVEQFNQDCFEHPIERNRRLWNEVIEPGLQDFIDEFHISVVT